jgi:hypothetical protein
MYLTLVLIVLALTFVLFVIAQHGRRAQQAPARAFVRREDARRIRKRY